MKAVLFLLTSCCSFACPAQTGYPVPPSSATRLFYIQHSNNYNTFVYDANMHDSSISVDNTLDIYRIVYTEGGVKKPLTGIQRKMAYGMDVRCTGKNSFEMNLAASKKLTFYLVLDDKKRPAVYVIVNNHKLYLDNMYVKLREGSLSLSPKAEYVLFTGKDFSSHEPVTEKVIPKS